MISAKRKIGLVILGNDGTGKGHMIRGMFNETGKTEKRVRTIKCGDKKFTGYVFIRSYQELEKSTYNEDVERCFERNDAQWFTRDFIIIPSHIDSNSFRDINNIARTLNQHGFNVICCYILMNDNEIRNYADILTSECWFLKIEIMNEYNEDNWEKQTAEIGNMLRQILCNELSI